MDVKFYSLSTLPTAVAGGAGSFVNVTTGADAGMYYCTGAAYLKLDNVAQDKAGEVKTAAVDASTGVASFKNAEDTEVFTLALADYMTAEVSKLTGSATIASAADGVVTIKAGVAEVDGKIANATGDDITLAKVATTGKAEDILLDPNVQFGSETETTVQEAIEALADAFDGIAEDAANAIAVHASDAAIHVTASQKEEWSAKQDAFDNADVLSGITAASVAAWDAKQDAIAENTYDAYGAAASALAAAKDYADTIASNYDEAGAAAAALVSAKAYSDALASNYDEAGAAAAVLGSTTDTATAKTVCGAISKAQEIEDGLGTAAAKDVATTDITIDTTDENLVNSKQVADFVKTQVADLNGAMHFEGVVEGETLAAAVSAKTDYTPEAGDVIIWGVKEYVYSNGTWVELGDEGAWEAKGTAQSKIDALRGEASSTAGADVVVTVTTSKGEVTSVAVDSSVINGRVEALEADTHEHDNKAVLDGITAASVAAWDAKQDAIAENTYDAYGSSAAALVSAKAYSDALASNYDEAGAATSVKSEVIGTAADTSAADTINGAKAYADAAVEAATLVWLSEFPTA